MDWTKFQTNGEAPEQAFESMCNQLFERWCRREYGTEIQSFRVINGAGGDGGVEAYAERKTGEGIGHQAKWFTSAIDASKISQIRGSIKTAMKVRPQIKRYIICLSRNLASKKLVKGTEVTQNSEEAKVSRLLDEMKETYPDLDIELWDEHQLLEELQQPGAEGVYRFWFQNQEISQESLEQKFRLAKDGWLCSRYISELHMQGRIHTAVDVMLRTREARTSAFDQLLAIKQELDQAVRFVKSCSEEEEEITAGIDLPAVRCCLEKQLQDLEPVLTAMKYGDDCELPNLDGQEISKALEQLQKKPEQSGLAIVEKITRLKRILQSLEEKKIERWLWTHQNLFRHRDVLVIGGPGTGKTHGLAHAVEKRIEQKLPAIIIQAKNAPVAGGWEEIMPRVLGLPSWTADEIWSALEACAMRQDVARQAAKPTGADADALQDEAAQILICVDGIDEASDRAAWMDCIGQLARLRAMHPRLCFCVSGRLCGFDQSRLPETCTRINLQLAGDTAVSSLFDAYMNHYRIDAADAAWIKWALQSPLALKLFCELYHDRRIDRDDRIDFSVLGLIRRKMQLVEAEIDRNFQAKWSENENVGCNSLVILCRHFLSEPVIERGAAIQELQGKLKPAGIVTAADAGKLLDYFCDSGFLRETTEKAESLIMPEKRYYQISYTQFSDYFMAISGMEQILDEERLPAGLEENQAICEFIALMLLADRGIFIGTDGWLTDEFPPDKMLGLQLFALRNVDSRKSGSYRDWVRQTFLQSPEECRFITEGLLLKTARRQGHPFAPSFLHELLDSRSSMGARDTRWSVPVGVLAATDMLGKEDACLEIKLYREDHWDGMPLLLAWKLTTVDDSVRRHCRVELTKWGIDNIGQWMQLLRKMFTVNDLQLREDMACASCSIANLSHPAAELKTMAVWAVQTLSASAANPCLDAAIRQACRGIAERAFALGLIPEAVVQTARPPYAPGDRLLPLDQGILQDPEEGCCPICGDLDWYVIKKAYLPFFGRPQTMAAKLLQEYQSQYHCAIDAHVLAKAIAQYLIRHWGWGEAADRGIANAYQMETHGSRSPVMTFGEKYVWLAVHILLGFFSDRLLIEDLYDNTWTRLTDYNMVMQLEITPIEVCAQADTAADRAEWFLPSETCPRVKGLIPGEEKTRLIDWIGQDELFELSPWLRCEGQRLQKIYNALAIQGNHWYSLDLFSVATEPATQGQTLFWANAFLADRDDFLRLRADAVQGTLPEFPRDAYDAACGIKCDCYVSPVDVVSMPWIQEAGSVRETGSIRDSRATQYCLYPTTTRMTNNSLAEGDHEYTLPSQRIREALQICRTTGECCYNARDELVSFLAEVRQGLDDRERILFCSGDQLESAWEKEKKQLFWVVRVQREGNPHGQRKPGIAAVRDRRLLVWLDQGEWKSILLFDRKK